MGPTGYLEACGGALLSASFAAPFLGLPSFSMPSNPPSGPPVTSVLQRAYPWLVLVGVLVVGVILCFTIGPQVIPFFQGGPK